MKLLTRIFGVLLFLGATSSLLALQRNAFDNYRPDFGSSGDRYEFSFTRLRYPTRTRGFGGFGGFRGGGWSEDYPKADRQFMEGVDRLTRLDGRPVQEVVDPDSDEMFNWPWMYAVNVSDWDFNPEQAKRMREYLLKGGFLIVDSFHGTAEWQSFMAGMREIFPDRTPEELTDKDELFHVLYDLDKEVRTPIQVPGYQYIFTGQTYERDGIVPHWYGVRDDTGRIMIAMGFNQHIGDAWEHADDPRYPERFSSFAYRLGINYIMYGLTH